MRVGVGSPLFFSKWSTFLFFLRNTLKSRYNGLMTRHHINGTDDVVQLDCFLLLPTASGASTQTQPMNTHTNNNYPWPSPQTEKLQRERERRHRTEDGGRGRKKKINNPGKIEIPFSYYIFRIIFIPCFWIRHKNEHFYINLNNGIVSLSLSFKFF